jgi:hypothetical protein
MIMPRILLFIVMLMGFAMTVHAQADQQAPAGGKELKKSFLYQWTDKKGVVHITDGLDKVPKKYRDKAEKLNQTEREDADQGQGVQGSGHSSGFDTGEADAEEKAAWQQRMRDARERLADAEQKHQVLVQRRDELLRSWGGPASGRLDERIEADKVEQEMKELQKEIDKDRNDIDVVIPEKARKAGVPPGWLRE